MTPRGNRAPRAVGSSDTHRSRRHLPPRQGSSSRHACPTRTPGPHWSRSRAGVWPRSRVSSAPSPPPPRGQAPGGPGRRTGVSHARAATPHLPRPPPSPGTWRLMSPARPHRSCRVRTPRPTQVSLPASQGLKATPCTGSGRRVEDTSSQVAMLHRARVSSPQPPGETQRACVSSPGVLGQAGAQRPLSSTSAR